MSSFVMVTDDIGFRYAINVDSILWISPDTSKICLSVASGAWDGIMTLSHEDIKRLLDMTGMDGHGER